MPARRPASADVRAETLDRLQMTRDQLARIHGVLCARCSGTDDLRDGGMAYTRNGPEGARLAWRVRVCRHCRKTGGTQ